MLRIILAILFLAACGHGAGVDVPTSVAPDYEARERAQMVDTDRCGPAFIQDKLPGPVQRVIGPLADGPFRPVCARHDACYRLGEKTQSWCDDRMRAEMTAICDTGKAGAAYSVPGIGPSLCRFHGSLYYTAINSTFGSVAYGDGAPAGEITALRIQRIRDVLTDDEITLCADVRNPSKLMQEYDIELHDARGKLIDREPDLYEKNVRPGETEEFCVGTNFLPNWSVSNLTDTVYVSIRADIPTTFATSNDMVIVDTQSVKIR